MLMSRSDLTTEVRTLLSQRNSTDNSLLTDTMIQDELDRAYGWLAAEARLFRRMATMAAVDLQADYVLPYDFIGQIEAVRYGSTDETPLQRTEIVDMKAVNADWRTADASTDGPSRWIPLDGRQISLYAPPDISTATSFYLYGYVSPLSIGDSISTIARAANVITITTAAAHNLQAGDAVTVQRCATAGLNVDLTVATVTSTTSFTAAHTGTNQSDTSGYVTYAHGILPLVASTDVPLFSVDYHEILAYRACYRLGRTVLASDAKAQAALPGIADLQKEALAGLKTTVGRV